MDVALRLLASLPLGSDGRAMHSAAPARHFIKDLWTVWTIRPLTVSERAAPLFDHFEPEPRPSRLARRRRVMPLLLVQRASWWRTCADSLCTPVFAEGGRKGSGRGSDGVASSRRLSRG